MEQPGVVFNVKVQQNHSEFEPNSMLCIRFNFKRVVFSGWGEVEWEKQSQITRVLYCESVLGQADGECKGNLSDIHDRQ